MLRNQSEKTFFWVLRLSSAVCSSNKWLRCDSNSSDRRTGAELQTPCIRGATPGLEADAQFDCTIGEDIEHKIFSREKGANYPGAGGSRPSAILPKVGGVGGVGSMFGKLGIVFCACLTEGSGCGGLLQMWQWPGGGNGPGTVGSGLMYAPCPLQYESVEAMVGSMYTVVAGRHGTAISGGICIVFS